MAMERDGKRKLAFVIDDDAQEQERYSLALTREGFEIKVFSNEEDSVAALKTTSPNIALIHFSEDMARTIRLIKLIHELDPTVCILYFTFYLGEPVHQRAVELGAYMVLNKPLSLFSDKFGEIIEKALQESLRRKRLESGKNKVFVLMPFAKKFDELYRLAIKEPLESLGFVCERVDEIQFAGDIVEKVNSQIQQAELIVADMTGKNPNVFYEVGYAHALGKVVILLTQNANDIPFDLRGQKHIVYGRSMLKLRDELTKVVKTLANLPVAPNNSLNRPPR